MMLILSSAFVFAIAKIRFISLIYNFLYAILLKKKHLDCLRGSIMTHLRKFVSSVPEYRRTSRGNFKHKLEDILMLVILGRLSKCINRAEVPCTTTGVTLILYLHTHSVRALLWLLMFAKRKVMKSNPCPDYWIN